ncbi:rho GTPase-activating protein 32 isoform X9 [Tachysurus fulvidraco]|uniref:rho GTPase-activating protein 32 isoform X9 n=1 Tax=Tachysurus fulvidraco TaxID=1234273 RepID=UPI001FEE4E98|nr:rho GTPase-activating protein 32 isoform X9 [Tachysurus fulvidraco]
MEAGSGAAAVVGSTALGLYTATGSHDISDRGLRPGRNLEADDIVPELARSIHPRERPDWEETISAMARSAEIPELSSEPLIRSCSSTASMKVKNVKKLPFTKGHFPKLAECAHFHYENVDFGSIQLSLAEEQSEVSRNGLESKELVYLVHIYCQGRSWMVRRSYEDFRVLDKHLHLCIYDRRFSQLPELPRYDSLRERAEAVSQMLMAYLSRLSAIADNKINCGPVLTWMEVDNKGNRLLVHEESSINVPAIAAAHVIKRYIAQAADELSFEVGDIVSVIDMPPKEDTTWWRGKHGFQVGFFPSECVELINDKVPQSVTNSVPKPASPCSALRPASWSLFPPYLEMESVKQDSALAPDPLNPYRLSSVSKKHGKLITFLRTFMKSRPTKQKLKQRGILRERVFGCDLGEHLLNSGHDVPQVLKSCTEFIEKHGIVDGMYRLSGIASNIQKLRHEFDSEQIPDLTKDVYIQDIHCVGSLCKLYFRELPNPLLTYQLYEKFSEAVSAATDEERLIKIHDVIQQLPPPHYRTLEFLMRHLSRLAAFSYVTNMHSKNLAIVWAPNLLRSKQIESACFSGTAAFMEVRIQSVVVEFILNHVDVLFSQKLSSLIREGAGHNSLSRPKSLLVPSPSTKLLTLEEAQARTQAQINSPVTADSKYIEVGEGPAALQGKFHTVIEFPTERKRQPIKSKKSPVGSWRSFFNLGKSSSTSKRKLHRNPSEPNELKAMALGGSRGDTGTLRSAKSEESLTSLHNVEGESKVYRPRRPRSSSDALSTSFNGDLMDSRQHCNSYDNIDHGDSEGDDGPICVPALISPPRSTDDVDLSPPDIGMATLDFDPMSFQCSLPLAESSAISHDTEAVSLKRSPGSASDSEPVSPVRPKITSLQQSPDLSPAFRSVSNSSEKIMFQSSDSSERFAELPPLHISQTTDTCILSKGSESPEHQPSTTSLTHLQDSPAKVSLLSFKSTDLPLSKTIHLELLSKSASCENKEALGIDASQQVNAQEQPELVCQVLPLTLCMTALEELYFWTH